jgi:hypothetical protein
VTLRHAILEATVPNVAGTVDYTAPGISNWSAGGLALIFVSGDTAAPTFGGFLTVGLVDSSGGQRSIAWNAVDAATTIPENKENSANDHAVVILDNTAGTGFVSIARAQFSLSLATGVRLNWTSVAGVGARVFKLVIVLLEGFASSAVGDGGAFTWGFQADGILHVPNGNGSFSAWPNPSRNAQECTPGLGGARRDGGVSQKSAYVVSDRVNNPLISRGGRRTTAWSATSNGVSEFVGTVTAFTATGVTVSGTSRGMFAAMRSAVSDYVFALETLDGTTGLKTFSGLGSRCGLIVGFVCGVTSDDTFAADAAALAPAAYFVTDGITTISLGMSQRHNGANIAGGNPTDTYSSFSSGSVLMVDHLNATDFLATVAKITSSGLQLQVSNALSGTLFLFGFLTSPVVEFPDPVALALNLPAPTVGTLEKPTAVPLPLVLPAVVRLQAGAENPTPVHLALVLPAVTRTVPITKNPNAVPLALVLPVPIVSSDFEPVQTPEHDLEPDYRAALTLLLPRGLAWRPVPRDLDPPREDGLALFQAQVRAEMIRRERERTTGIPEARNIATPLLLVSSLATSPVEIVVADLEPGYVSALEALLPRGLAWPRRVGP